MGLKIDRLIALREKQGWSQRELARRCGFAASLLRNYESGESDPSSTYLQAIADQLGVSTDYLLGRSDDPDGNVIRLELTPEEQQILDAFRRERWRGIMRLLQEHLSNK
jgi:transcriptional regulator with XRE-family HTH domain